MGSNPIDARFRALMNERRRQIALQLLEDDQIEIRTPLEVRLSLIHQHLPTLKEAGIVQFDNQGDKILVSRGEHWEDAKSLIKYIEEDQNVKRGNGQSVVQ